MAATWDKHCVKEQGMTQNEARQMQDLAKTGGFVRRKGMDEDAETSLQHQAKALAA